MTDNLDKLKDLLAELFMLDQADLDFGIYRVMNAKRAEVTRFLDNDLLPQVRTELEKISTGDRAGIETELTKAIAAARAAGFTAEQAEQSPKVADLRAQLAATVDVSALENEVLSDLANFFRRYYSGGDFLALRRYKAGVYAIPYEGEEVKLHWANADQYYIKTSEFLRDYTFKLADGMHVNICQYRHYLKLHGREREVNRTILLTPNEGLSRQHQQEFAASGIEAEIFSKESTGLFAGHSVEILEITKLTEDSGDKTVAVDAFEGNNLVLVDEGHRGAGGFKWKNNRDRLCEKGFSFEYSATFSQALKAANKPELTEEYAKCVLFDYSYKYFYRDGFGKDYKILNLADDHDEERDQIQRRVSDWFP
jgi:hypothetical protein